MSRQFENEQTVEPHYHECSDCGRRFVCASPPLESGSGALIHHGYLNRREFCQNVMTDAAERRTQLCNACLKKTIFMFPPLEAA